MPDVIGVAGVPDVARVPDVTRVADVGGVPDVTGVADRARGALPGCGLVRSAALPVRRPLPVLDERLPHLRSQNLKPSLLKIA
ncbi:MAG TPA: hypothetical protein VL984_02420 [Acidimicrobiales bacterium]|nr:hypothetical protein [Acidimicrobiales bacterium]